jgi:hypothetical protein
MRKTILTIAILTLIWISYLAWPLYDLFQLARAIERRDIATVTQQVDFYRVRQSFTQQIVEAYLRRTATRAGPLVQGAALTIADPIVAKFISPEALAELLRAGWPVGVLENRPPDTVGISVATLGTVWDLFAGSDYGVGRFEVNVPATFAADRAFGLGFRLASWRWRLTSVRLPEHICVLLADEIIKSTRTNPPAAP